ncbi:MAG: SPFH domain-containing protein, partial [Myxococcota bacterium]
MGLMEKMRHELIDIIEWVDDSRHTLVWRFPRHHNQIKFGAQLIVRPGQMAVFVRQGEVADVFGPGQHRLETRNLPILSTLAAWKYGFDSPFKAEVYFASTRQITDLKWGTPNPVMMRDPDFGPVRVRAFGTYTLKASKPRVLLKELVGADSEFEADEITELLRSIISTAFADVTAKAEIGLLDLASNYGELSEQVRQIALDRIDDEYGLEIPQLYIVNISVPAEVEQALDTRSSMNVIGDMSAFQRYQLGQATPIAAANPAGGLAGAGVGLGMGMAIAGPMMGGGGHASTPPPQPAPPAWHLVQNGQASGPFSLEQVAQGIATGAVGPGTMVWTVGMTAWTTAAAAPQLAPLFPATPP